MNAQVVKDVPGIVEHIDQVTDRRALIAADIGHPRLQQRLGDGENPLAMQFAAVAEAQLLDFPGKGPFGHPRCLAFVVVATRSGRSRYAHPEPHPL